MSTRSAAAREAASLRSQSTGYHTTITSPAIIKKNQIVTRGNDSCTMTCTNEQKAFKQHEPSDASPRQDQRKGKRAGKLDHDKVNGPQIMSDWDELPHNMGKRSSISMSAAETEHSNNNTEVGEVLHEYIGPKVLLNGSTRHPRNTRTSKTSVAGHTGKASSNDGLKDPISKELRQEFKRETSPEPKLVISPRRSNRKRKVKVDEDLRTEIEDSVRTGSGHEEPASDQKPRQKRASVAKKLKTSAEITDKVEDIISAAEQPVKTKVPRKKKNPYGLTPGESPFPEFEMPTVEACWEVTKLLSGLHGQVVAPKEIPAPSLEVSGCGEVPSVLDALIRTRLSASTSGTNAAYAFQGLVDRYGIYEEGIGKGSVNWNKVRESALEEIELAIRKGGLSKTKSKDIKNILDMVHKQNMVRSEAFMAEKSTGQVSDVLGSESKSQGQKDLEIESANASILSLQYMHGLDSESAMMEFVKYPGIGVKTASCVILFCLQRPSFAVDTHVYRMCQWLNWTPSKATRDQTFSHCEVRIPNELKYPLHQLFIRHGKTCGKCRAITGETSEAWEKTVCPIEHLVRRTGARKGGTDVNSKKGIQKRKTTNKVNDWDGDIEDDTSEPELVEDSD